MNYPLLYLEHLTGRDLALLAEEAGLPEGARSLSRRLRQRPELIDDLLASPGLFQRLVDVSAEEGLEVRVSPFLVFSVLVHRAARELEELEFVQEWTGPRQRLPVFDVAPLRGFLARPANRYHLTELLASFTRVASGTFWTHTPRGPRRRRFSELNLPQMAAMVDEAEEHQRPGLYRRLGDVALFLTGVFPDHTAGHPPSMVEVERLTRTAGMGGAEVVATLGGAGGLSVGTVLLFEELGRRWYLKADDATRVVLGRRLGFYRDLAEDFRPARRTLNLLTDRYLYRFETDWFPPPSW